MVVDPVAGEPAGADERPLGPAVGMQGERERGPGEWSLPLDERCPADAAGGGHPGATTGGLCEAPPTVAALRLVLDVWEGDRLEHVAQAADADRCAPDLATTRVAGVGDPSRPVHLHPGREVVGEAEAVGFPQLVEVPENVGGRLVVVSHSGVEGQARAAHHGFGGDP